MTKKNKIKAIRGMKDVLPQDSSLWLSVEAICAEILSDYNYQQIKTPILENTQLFARSIGADTDIVSKEMYTFEDRNGDSVTMRPEGTASCVRAGIEHGLFYNQQQRLWYAGPMFRHERPQKGRFREFFQIGAECFGWPGADIEAELLSLTAQIFSRLGLKNTRLELNTLGDTACRADFRSALIEYLHDYKQDLDQDSLRRLDSNPLRILDSKNSEVQQVLMGAPDIHEFLSAESNEHFLRLKSYLQQLDITFSVNPRLVRGLDYYNDTVFEWVNEDYGAQSAVCAGGRYDSMVEQLGGPPTPCFGFAMGLERLIQMLQEQGAEIVQRSEPVQVFIVSIGEQARGQALRLQQLCCAEGIRVQLYCGSGSMKNQFKRADSSGAQFVLVIGEQEAATETVGIRSLQVREEQQIIAQNDVVNAVTNRLESL
ncbi:MAG: histidine--tRNA ligase [Arenicella sp.]|nr:histidine--tRNA ligase [Arenicella sp.]